MNIFNKFNVIDTQTRIMSDFGKGFTSDVKSELSYEDNSPWSQVYEYRTLLRVRFSAGKQDYDMALENAKKQTQSYLYNDVLISLLEMKTCVYNGDARATLEEIDKLRNLIMDID